MIFKETFKGVPDGEIYPVEYQPGDECPPELEAAAAECGVLEAPDVGADAKPAGKKAAAK